MLLCQWNTEDAIHSNFASFCASPTLQKKVFLDFWDFCLFRLLSKVHLVAVYMQRSIIKAGNLL